MAGGKNIWENVIVFILLGIIVCLVTPIIQGLFYNSQVSGAKSSAEELVSSISILYGNFSMEREIVLPFTMQFRENKTYDIYEDTTKISSNQLLEKGNKPISGSIVMDKNGEIYAQNITYDNGIVCNMEKGKEMQCVRTKKTGK